MGLVRNKLAYPAGQRAGCVSHAILGSPLLLAVPSGATFIDLASGMIGTPTDIYSTGDADLGLVNHYNTSTLGSGVQFTVPSSNVLIPRTFFAFIRVHDFNFAQVGIISCGTGSAPEEFNLSGVTSTTGVLRAQSLNGGNHSFTGVTLQAGVPYFVAMSVFANASGIGPNAHVLVLNLQTGQIQTDFYATNPTYYTPPGSTAVRVGATSGGVGFSGQIAAAAIYPVYVSPAELLHVARDPWALWYPQNSNISALLDRLQLVGLSGGSTITAGITETATATSTWDNTGTLLASITEAATASDTFDSNFVAAAITETATATDIWSNVATLIASITESSVASETVDGAIVIVASLIELATATNSQDATVAFSVSQTENAPATETLSVVMNMLAAIGEQATATEVAAASPGSIYNVSVTENAFTYDIVNASGGTALQTNTAEPTYFLVDVGRLLSRT